MSEPRPTQNRRPEPLKHNKDPNVGYLVVFALDFFQQYETFFEKVLFTTIVSIICNRRDGF